jgi:hypothetical protein
VTVLVCAAVGLGFGLAENLLRFARTPYTTFGGF